MITLRDYQNTAVGGVRDSFAGGCKSVCLVLPTGGGKTIIFAFIAYTSAMRGKKVLILVHRKELIKQTAEKLKLFGSRAGIISPDFRPDYNAMVQVAMVQSMASRGAYYRNFDLVVTDECHHVAASTYMRAIERYPDAYQLGVTATPIRTDGKGLGRAYGGIYDEMVVGPQTADLIASGYLVEPIIHVPPSLVDMSGVKKIGGDFNAKQTTERVDKKSITGNAIDHYLSTAKYQPAVVFCASVSHAQHVAAEWREMGIRALAVDGSQRGKEKIGTEDYVDRALRGLGDGSVHAIMSCSLISEGTDIPAISYMADLAPTASLGLHIQKIGRTLRPKEGKAHAVIMDHVGNVGAMRNGLFLPNHGLPTDLREWTLEGEMRTKRKKKEDTTTSVCLCESCYSVYERKIPVCPYCGFERPIKVRQLEQQEGELVQLQKEQLIAQQLEKKQARQAVGRAQTLEELEAIASQRGYKRGWAKHVFNSRQKNI